MIDFDKIEERLKQLLNVNTGKDVAVALGISETTYNTKRHRESIPFVPIINLCNRKGIDLNNIFKI